VLAKYNNDIPNFFTGAQCNDTGYSHLLYKGSEGGTYKTHIDSFDKEPRLISISILLNDNFDGGETFFGEGPIVRPAKNKTIIFSGVNITHGVNKVLNGERYTIATWYKKK